MDEEIPKKFDLIVIGTGFPESCIAAAASRIEKSVLHIDPNEYYGGAWASFNLEAFYSLMEGSSKALNKEIKNVTHKWYINEKDVESNDDNTNDTSHIWSVSKLMQNSRKFNLDLCPKILYSSGELVQLLITSNICRYAEFRAIDNIWTLHDNQLLNVPCSRSDVFNTKDLNMVEKRLLMKFLNNCLTYDITEKTDKDTLNFHDKTFSEYLKEQKLTEKINRCIMQAIAMSKEDVDFLVGMKRTKKFLQSLGRYSNTPFIFPMYGCGELPQCFCRLCAVFGGIYCLKKQITRVQLKETDDKVSVEVNGQQIVEADYVVCSPGNLPEQFRETTAEKNSLSRGIILTTTPLKNNDEENSSSGGGGVSLLRLLSSDGQSEALCIQLSHHSGTCPKDVYIFHLITPAKSDDPTLDLQPFQDELFNSHNTNLQILYAAYFTICGNDFQTDLSGRILGTLAPSYDLDYDGAIENARNVFEKLYGNTVEFLPRAPDPEEIIIDGEDPQALVENQLPEDLRIQLNELSMTADTMEIGENDSMDAD